MAVDDLLGAIWLPGDGKVNPTDLTMALARGARSRGSPDRRAGAGPRDAGRPTGRAGRGSPGSGPTAGSIVEAEVVVNCAGQWAKALGDPVGRHGAAALGRALLRRHRPARGRAPGPADPARPRRLDLLQGGGRRPGGRRLRARGEAVGVAATTPAPVRVPAARGGLGALLGADGLAAAADPGAGRDRASASSTTARRASRPTTSSCWARRPACPATSSAPASTRSASPRRAARAGRWPSGSSRASRPSDLVGVDVRRFAPFHGDKPWLRGRVAEILGLHYAVPVAQPRARDRPRPSGSRRCTTGSRPRGACSAPAWAGSGRSSSRRPGERPARLRLGQAGLAAPGRPRSSAPAGRRWPSSTRRRSPSTPSPGPTRSPPCSGSAPTTSTCRSGRRSTRRCSTRRGTYESDLTVTRIGADEFLLVSSSATTVRDLDWIDGTLPDGAEVDVGDVTDGVRRARA